MSSVVAKKSVQGSHNAALGLVGINQKGGIEKALVVGLIGAHFQLRGLFSRPQGSKSVVPHALGVVAIGKCGDDTTLRVAQDDDNSSVIISLIKGQWAMLHGFDRAAKPLNDPTAFREEEVCRGNVLRPFLRALVVLEDKAEGAPSFWCVYPNEIPGAVPLASGSVQSRTNDR